MRGIIIGLIFILALGLLAASLPAEAQQAGKMLRIGIVLSGTPTTHQRFADAFLQGMREYGWIEGQNIAVEYRWAAGRFGADHLSALFDELIDQKVDLIMTGGTMLVRAAKNATNTIPIVMGIAANVVEAGLVDSLARPGGNITGYTDQLLDLQKKQLELLKETLPEVTRVAFPYDPDSPFLGEQLLREAQDTGQALGLTIQPLEFRSPKEFESGLEAAAQGRPGALLIVGALYHNFGRLVAEFAAKYRVAVFSNSERGVERYFGLLSYAPDYVDACRRSATYADKIFKGAKPADLPVERPHKFDLVLNLKTAKALGIMIPPMILYQATRIIR